MKIILHIIKNRVTSKKHVMCDADVVHFVKLRIGQSVPDHWHALIAIELSKKNVVWITDQSNFTIVNV